MNYPEAEPSGYQSDFSLSLSYSYQHLTSDQSMYDRTFLIRLVQARMPYGRYEGRYITDLPVHYLEWFSRQGFPEGQLGQYLATMYEIKINGLNRLLWPIIQEYRQGGFSD